MINKINFKHDVISEGDKLKRNKKKYEKNPHLLYIVIDYSNENESKKLVLWFCFLKQLFSQKKHFTVCVFNEWKRMFSSNKSVSGLFVWMYLIILHVSKFLIFDTLFFLARVGFRFFFLFVFFSFTLFSYILFIVEV